MKPEDKEMPNSELKSSFPSTFAHQPWLIQLDPSNKHGQVFIDPVSAKTTIKKIEALEKKICLGSYQEWLLLLYVPTKETFLFSPISGIEICLPVLSEPLESLGGFVLTSEPTSAKCTIVFACKGQQWVLHCRPNGPQWIKVPFPTLRTRMIGQIVVCKDKLYALTQTRYGHHIELLTIDLESLPTGVTEYAIIKGPDYDNRDASQVMANSDHLVVSGENILLVSFYLTFREVARVEAYLLNDTSNIYWNRKYKPDINWKRTEISDRRIFFLSTDYNVSFIPNNADIQSNSVYLLQSDKLYKINWDDLIISSLLLPKRIMTEWNKICWVVPSRSRTRKEKSAPNQNGCLSEKGTEKIMIKDNTTSCHMSRSWADLPIELVDLLLPHLGLVDCMRLPSICKAWSSLSNPRLEIWPLLMYFPNDCSTCRLFDPISNTEFSLDMEWFTTGKKCTLHFSKDGWVLLSIENHNYVVNPFTRESIELPCRKFADACSFSFYSLPTSDDFMVFVTWDHPSSHLKGIYMWWPGEEKWISESAPADDFCLPMGGCNPVVYDDELYCLGRSGDLGVIDPYNDVTWDFLETPVHTETPTIGTEDCYLLEFEEQLISVFRERTKKEVRIFILDYDEWVWNKKKDLGDLTLFLDNRGSVAKKLMLGRNYANRIYFSGFNIHKDRKVGAYYSVDSGSYHPRFDNLQKPMNCVWLEPKLTVNNNPTNL